MIRTVFTTAAIITILRRKECRLFSILMVYMQIIINPRIRLTQINYKLMAKEANLSFIQHGKWPIEMTC